MLPCLELKKYILYSYFFNMDISVAIAITYFKYGFSNMEGMVSQNFDIGPSLCFMKYRKLVFIKYQNVSLF